MHMRLLRDVAGAPFGRGIRGVPVVPTTPRCEKCGTPMVWYRAALLSYEPRSLLHYYSCKACAHIATVTRTAGMADSAPTYFKNDDIASGIPSSSKKCG